MWKNSDNVSTRGEGWAPVPSADSLSTWSRDCIVANSTAVSSRSNRTKCLAILRLLQVLGLTQMKARALLCGGRDGEQQKNQLQWTVRILRGVIPQRKQLLNRLKTQPGSGMAVHSVLQATLIRHGMQAWELSLGQILQSESCLCLQDGDWTWDEFQVCPWLYVFLFSYGFVLSGSSVECL